MASRFTRKSLEAPFREINQKGALSFLMLLISADLTFFLFHLLLKYTPWLAGVRMAIESDRGYAEVFQYIKEFWIAGLLVLLFVRTRRGAFLVWSFLFIYLLGDDSFMLHETWGAAIASSLGEGSFLHLRMQDYGELIVSSGVLLIFLIFLLPALRKCSRLTKQITMDLCLLIAMMAFFGVLIDMLHIVLFFISGSDILSLFEDGGEMIIMSVTCSYVFYVWHFKGDIPISFWFLMRKWLCK